MQACGDGDEVLMLIQRELVVQSQCQTHRFGFGEDCLSKAIPVSTWAEQGKRWVGLFKKKRVRLVESRRADVCDVQR